MIPRSQLFAAVVGGEIGKALNNALNAYALGKAARVELDELRGEIAKCGDSCSVELKTRLHKDETGQALVEETIEDAAIKNNLPVAWEHAMKNFLSIEPHQMTSEEKGRNDEKALTDIISTYCYTISDQIHERQQQCEDNTPYKIARSIDKLLQNMCNEKVSKQVGFDVNDTSLQLSNDKQVYRKYNQALGDARECFWNTSYYYGWIKSAYKSCGIEWHNPRDSAYPMKPEAFAEWCIPEPTNEASNYKLLSSNEVEFDWNWLHPSMQRMDVRPKVHKCIYGGGPNTTGTAEFYFWAQEPPPLHFGNGWGGVKTVPISNEGVGGEKFAYDFVGDGHYLGIRATEECPADLEKAIRLRQRLLEEVMPSFIRPKVVPSDTGP